MAWREVRQQQAGLAGTPRVDAPATRWVLCHHAAVTASHNRQDIVLQSTYCLMSCVVAADPSLPVHADTHGCLLGCHHMHTWSSPSSDCNHHLHRVRQDLIIMLTPKISCTLLHRRSLLTVRAAQAVMTARRTRTQTSAQTSPTRATVMTTLTLTRSTRTRTWGPGPRRPGL